MQRPHIAARFSQEINASKSRLSIFYNYIVPYFCFLAMRKRPFRPSKKIFEKIFLKTPFFDLSSTYREYNVFRLYNSNINMGGFMKKRFLAFFTLLCIVVCSLTLFACSENCSSDYVGAYFVYHTLS